MRHSVLLYGRRHVTPEVRASCPSLPLPRVYGERRGFESRASAHTALAAELPEAGPPHGARSRRRFAGEDVRADLSSAEGAVCAVRSLFAASRAIADTTVVDAPDVRFAKSGETSIAYATVGDGPFRPGGRDPGPRDAHGRHRRCDGRRRIETGGDHRLLGRRADDPPVHGELSRANGRGGSVRLQGLLRCNRRLPVGVHLGGTGRGHPRGSRHGRHARVAERGISSSSPRASRPTRRSGGGGGGLVLTSASPGAAVAL